MENFFNLVPLVVLIPLAGLLINLFTGRQLGERGVSIVAVGASATSFLIAVLLWIAQVNTGYKPAVVNVPLLSNWINIPAANLTIPWAFRVDTLSVTMMLVVTGVGTLIHLYSVGYMHGDERYPRFFVYLNLFLALMLILVTANNFLVMFVGWEGVGLCSYLLIGFWFDKAHGEGWKNSDAARKAFIVNRIGDFGLVLAVLITFWTFGTLTFYQPGETPIAAHAAEVAPPLFAPAVPPEGEAAPAPTGPMGVFNQAETWLQEGNHRVKFGSVSLTFSDTLTIITLLFLLGVTGKSAQIPLFVWLPDAMQGPTPVSALIHAATMVTAGIYLMVRSSVFFHASELSSFLVTAIGATTALVGAFIALGQWDIKKVLAYSTISQLGYMVLAVGVGAYSAAMFHLVTHACFKGLLFLGAGSVMHGMEHGHHEVTHNSPQAHDDDFNPQDMRFMGGLRKKMPTTYWTYLFATLAIAGVVPFAGFWSKDEILLDSWRVGVNEGLLSGYVGFVLGLTAAALTAFYMWRQVCLVFLGSPRHAAADHAAESPAVMTWPLTALGILSLIIGFINIPSGLPVLGAIFGKHQFTSFLEHTVVYAHSGPFNLLMSTLAVALALGAIYVARLVYNDQVLQKVERDPLELDLRTSAVFRLSSAKLYWDEAYFSVFVYPYQRAARFLAEQVDGRWLHDYVHEQLIVRPFQAATRWLTEPVDKGVVDRAFNRLGDFTKYVAARLRRVQTGYLHVYALSVLFGALLVVLLILLPVIRELLGL